MYKIINNDPFFSDVKTESGKIKYNYLVSLISPLKAPNKPLLDIPLNTSLINVLPISSGTSSYL